MWRRVAPEHLNFATPLLVYSSTVRKQEVFEEAVSEFDGFLLFFLCFCPFSKC